MSEAKISDLRVDRHELADRWHRKGEFWSVPATAGIVPVAAMVLANSVVVDAFWSGFLVGVEYSVTAAQFGALVRMIACYRHAGKIRKGEVSS